MIKRSFIPGEQWVYYKIYCGHSVADRILTEHLPLLTKNLLQEKIINKWFFARYADPENHLRVRFCLNSVNDFGKVVLALNKSIKPLENAKQIWKVQLDTYIREIERYGAKTIESSEGLFFVNSMCTLEILNINLSKHQLILFCMQSINEILQELDLDIEDRLNLVSEMKEALNKEFKWNKSQRKLINQKYRKLEDDFNNKNLLSYNVDQFSAMKFKYIERSIKIYSLIKTNITPVKFRSILVSHIHMDINRLFSANQKVYEALIFEFLTKAYRNIKYQQI